jgi:hypothetical protein
MSNGMHATVEVGLREFIDENGGGPGVRLGSPPIYRPHLKNPV